MTAARDPGTERRDDDVTDKRFRFALALELAETRWRCGLTQTALADVLGISQGEVSRLERAVCAVSVERFVTWCAVCAPSAPHTSAHVLERAQRAALRMPPTITTHRKARAWRDLE